MTRAVAVAVAISVPWASRQRRLDERHVAVPVHDAPLADEPSGPHRPQEVDVELEGGLELVRREGGEQGRSHRVVEHRGDEGAEHVAHRVGEGLRRRERELDRALLGIRVDELEPQRGRGARDRRPAFDPIPERSGSRVHRTS